MASFTCFDHFGTVLAKLPEEYQGRLAAALILYGTQGVEPDLPYPLDAMFEGLRNDVDNSVNAKNRNKGGRPRKPVSVETENGGSVETETGVTETENGGFANTETGVTAKQEPKLSQAKLNQAKEERGGAPARRAKAFVPPNLEEVEAFWRDKSLRGSPSEFFNHYASCGWVVGRNKPMKDWHASAHQWSGRERQFGKPAAVEPEGVDYALYD